MDKQKHSKWATIAMGVLSGILFLYVVFGYVLTRQLYASEPLNHVNITLRSQEKQQFVTAQSVLDELGEMTDTATVLSALDLSAIERKLKGVVNIEDAWVARSQKGNLNINVVPMRPVARVFNSTGYSYYINREGKKLQADAKYHCDVPIVTGNIDDGLLNAVDLLPVLQYVNGDSLWNSLTTSFKVDENHDLLLIPIIKGHVVNLGNPTDKNIADKFARLKTIYRDVLPHKGWQFYDTLSVKFRGQVVATRARKREATKDLQFEYVDAEEVSPDNMDTSPSA